MAKPISQRLKLKTYHVTGVLQFMVPYDVDFKVKAYSKKQAVLKTFIDIRKDGNIKKLNRNLVYSEVRKLNYRELK